MAGERERGGRAKGPLVRAPTSACFEWRANAAERENNTNTRNCDPRYRSRQQHAAASAGRLLIAAAGVRSRALRALARLRARISAHSASRCAVESAMHLIGRRAGVACCRRGVVWQPAAPRPAAAGGRRSSID